MKVQDYPCISAFDFALGVYIGVGGRCTVYAATEQLVAFLGIVYHKRFLRSDVRLK